jgi:hypothetical protein
MRDTIDMAHEAGIDAWWDSGSDWRETFNEHLKAFEALVRADAIADEREACAKVCDDMGPCGFTGESCAEAIRARGNT